MVCGVRASFLPYFSTMEDINVKEFIQPAQPLAKVLTIEGGTSIDLSELDLITVSLDSYYKFKNIAYLHLSDNKLTELDENIFEKCPLLAWLDVRRNELKAIPKTLKNHANLRTILLSYNKIVKLPIELGSLPMLTGLEIKGNPLEFPPKEVIMKGLRNLINFFRSEWQSLQSITGSPEKPKENNDMSTPTETLPMKTNVKDMKSGIKTVNLSLVEHIWRTKLIELLENQEKELQKRKDKEEIKKWREKYIKQCLSNSQGNPVLLKPPFGVFDEFQKMLSRKDISQPLLEKQTMVTSSGAIENGDAEVQQLTQILQSLIDHNERSLEPNAQMSICLHEIRTLKGIIKKLSLLRTKN